MNRMLVKPKDLPDLGPLSWDDPLRFDAQLADEAHMSRDMHGGNGISEAFQVMCT